MGFYGIDGVQQPRAPLSVESPKGCSGGHTGESSSLARYACRELHDVEQPVLDAAFEPWELLPALLARWQLRSSISCQDGDPQQINTEVNSAAGRYVDPTGLDEHVSRR